MAWEEPPEYARPLLNASSVASRAIEPSWFVGRAVELALLADALPSGESGWGGMLVVAGERGIGKSRLIREACQRGGDAVQIIDGELMLAEAIDKAFLSTALKTLRENLHREFDRRGAASPVVVFDGLDDADPWMRSFFSGWDAFVPGFAARGAVLAGVRTHPVETNEAPSIVESLGRGGGAVALGPLNEQEIQVLLRVATPVEVTLSRELAARIQHLCEGNPELICALVGGATAGAGTERVNLSPASSLLGRDRDGIAAASALIRRFVMAAAVAGDEFDADLVARIAELPSNASTGATEFLVEKGVLVHANGAPRTFAFRRPLLQETIREKVIPTLAQRLHARFGAELEKSPDREDLLAERAYHWSRAKNADRALSACEPAGDEAFARGFYETAARWYATALSFADNECVDRLERKRADALGRLSRGTALLTAYEGILSRGDESEPIEVARMLLGAMISSQVECEMARAHAFAERIEALNLPTDETILLYSRIVNANVYAFESRYEEARAILNRIDPAKLRDAPRARIFFHMVRINAFVDRLPASERCARMYRLVQYAEQVGGPVQAASVLNTVAGLATIAGRLALAADAVHRAHSTALATSAEDLITDTHVQWADVAFLRGDLENGRLHILGAMSRGNDQTLLRIWFCLGISLGVLLEDRALVEACADDQLADLAFQSGDPTLVANVGANYALLWVVRGEMRKARALIKRTLAHLQVLPGGYWFTTIAAHHGEEQDVARARELLSQRVQIGESSAEAFLLLFDAIVARRDKRWHEAAKHGLEAAERFGAIGAPYFRAQSFEAAGRTARALDIYREIGDIRDVRRLERRRVTRGSDRIALTPRETEITALAASGLRSRDIAERLGLRERSVETYLQRAYAKLGIHARSQLPEH
jgi:DNA-binding CsgD family transcriptional regulator